MNRLDIFKDSGRLVESFDEGFRFLKGCPEMKPEAVVVDGRWKDVVIPHTWNIQDAYNKNEAEYYRGTAWYHREFTVHDSGGRRRSIVFFEAVNQDCEIYVNGKKAGEHHGGFTAFAVDITPYLRKKAVNTLLVKASNAFNQSVPPITDGDFTNFGGIYRGVQLVSVDEIHFDLSDGATGVYISTADLTRHSALINICGYIRNSGIYKKEIIVEHIILGPDGSEIIRTANKLYVEPGTRKAFKTYPVEIKNPELWSLSCPTLYTLRSYIKESIAKLRTRQARPSIFTPVSGVEGHGFALGKRRFARQGHDHLMSCEITFKDNSNDATLDSVNNRFGIRTVKVAPEKGFMLNGDKLFLKGVGKHQDYGTLGFAVPKQTIENDVRLARDMGANLLRSHYPLSQSAYEAADCLGIMGFIKLPVMFKINHTKEFYDSTRRMAEEMVLQYFNHPSVVLWGCSCEPFGDMDWYWPRPLDKKKVSENMRKTRNFFSKLEKVVKGLDPQRPTSSDYHTDPNPQFHAEAGLLDIQDINGWNIYQGWYHANLAKLPSMLRRIGELERGRPYIIAEYGAGSDTRIHAENPTISDFSAEYQDMLLKEYMKEVENNPQIAGMCIWTFADYHSKSRGDTMPSINNKGLLTIDRKPKDAYYLQQAHWSRKPMVHIAAADWRNRSVIADTGETVTRILRVYSNAAEAELFHNVKSLGVKPVVDREAEWEVPFIEGRNTLCATAQISGADVESFQEIRFNFIPRDLRTSFPQKRLCINVGQSRTFFHDPLTDDVWMPDRGYSVGSFGHLDGEYYRTWNSSKAWNGIREGVDCPILNTSIDLVFQAFLVGVGEYKIDTPDACYRVVLYFAEPFSEKRRCSPAEKTGADSDGQRIFRVAVNGAMLIPSLDIASTYGEQRAVEKMFIVEAKGGAGISIQFIPVKGQPVLNGIIVEKL
jgi:beta-galactosidase